MTDLPPVEAAIDAAHRRSWALVLAATVRRTRDLDLAEECVQEAYAAALVSWRQDGIPHNPEAWLTNTARRRAVDFIRRQQMMRSKLPLLMDPVEEVDKVEELAMNGATECYDESSEAVIPDERLRLIFMCCHPALAQEAQLALTLRLVCGVSTGDIARNFLVSETTMAARLTRAKKKIVKTRIPFRVPRPEDLPDRLRGVLGVIHLLFTTGHTAPSGENLIRTDLIEQSIELTRMLGDLLPEEWEVRGLLALLLVTDARRATRADARGRLLRLEDQDRSLWDRVAISEGSELIVDGLQAGRSGRYLLQAAIASLYAEAPSYADTDWQQIVILYDALLIAWPSPVVALNRTVALAMVSGPDVALAEVERLERDERLDGYLYLPAIKADLLLRLGRTREAYDAFQVALALAQNGAEREYLSERIADL